MLFEIETKMYIGLLIPKFWVVNVANENHKISIEANMSFCFYFCLLLLDIHVAGFLLL